MAAVVVSAGVATWLATREPPALTVELRPSYAIPELSDAYNSIQHRYWFGGFHATARAERPCDELQVAVRQLTSGAYGRAPVPLGDESHRGKTTELRGVFSGFFGQTVPIVAEATCRRGEEEVRAQASEAAQVTGRPCDGSLRVLESRGATGLDVGDSVEPGTHVLVLPRGQVVVGAPECNGFRAVLPPGRARVGDLGRSSPAPFVAKHVVLVRADAGAAAAAAEAPVSVRPMKRRCDGCALLDPASFALRSGGRRAAVRVYWGAVWLWAGKHRLRLDGGEEAFVDCREACTVSLSRPFQPGEAFALLPRQRKPLARMLAGPGMPARSLLAPERSAVQVVAVPKMNPAYLAVTWSQPVRDTHGVRDRRGLIVWIREGEAWRRAYRRTYPFWIGPDVRTAEVTRDALPELLVTEPNGGSGNCGIRRVLMLRRRSVEEIFRRGMCETDITAKDGDLVVPEPVGPCPVQPASAHCYGGIRTERLRWDGDRVVRFRVSVKCHAPHLDPLRGCEPRRRS